MITPIVLSFQDKVNTDHSTWVDTDQWCCMMFMIIFNDKGKYDMLIDMTLFELLLSVKNKADMVDMLTSRRQDQLILIWLMLNMWLDLMRLNEWGPETPFENWPFGSRQERKIWELVTSKGGHSFPLGGCTAEWFSPPSELWASPLSLTHTRTHMYSSPEVTTCWFSLLPVSLSHF